MKYIIDYYLTFAMFIFYKYKKRIDIYATGRVFEGIAIGLYATIIDRFIDKGITLDLTIKFIIAIIFTYIGITLSKKEK